MDKATMIEERIMKSAARTEAKLKDPFIVGMSNREKSIFNEYRNIFVNNLLDAHNNNLAPYAKDKLLNEYLYLLKNELPRLLKQFEGCHIRTIRRMLNKNTSESEK